MKTKSINRKWIKDLIEKSNLISEDSFLDFMEKTFSEIEKMVFDLSQSSFEINEGSDLVIRENSISLEEIKEINNLIEEECLSQDEKFWVMEKNCFLKNNKVVYKKLQN